MEQEFRKNELKYKEINRNNKFILFQVNNGTSYEVNQIKVLKKDVNLGGNIIPAGTNILSGNEDFGKNGSRCFYDYEKALNYFNGRV